MLPLQRDKRKFTFFLQMFSFSFSVSLTTVIKQHVCLCSLASVEPGCLGDDPTQDAQHGCTQARLQSPRQPPVSQTASCCLNEGHGVWMSLNRYNVWRIHGVSSFYSATIFLFFLFLLDVWSWKCQGFLVNIGKKSLWSLLCVSLWGSRFALIRLRNIFRFVVNYTQGRTATEEIK